MGLRIHLDWVVVAVVTIKRTTTQTQLDDTGRMDRQCCVKSERGGKVYGREG